MRLFIVDVIVNYPWDRYYNNEEVDYKKLVEQTKMIDDNYVQRDLLSDGNHVSNEQYIIETKRKQELESTTHYFRISNCFNIYYSITTWFID